MHSRIALFRAVGVAFFAMIATSVLSGVAETSAPPQNSPFVSAGTIREFLRIAPAKAGAMARVQGFVIYQENRSVIVQDRSAGVLVESGSAKPLPTGTAIEAIGIISRGMPAPTLQNATIRPIHLESPPPPLSVTPAEVLDGRHNMRLIRVRARLAGREQRGNALWLKLKADDVGFQAQLGYPFPGDPLAYVTTDSLLQVTGVCTVQKDGTGGARAFELLLRTPKDVVVLSAPTWWTTRHLGAIAAVLGFVILLGAAWAIAVRIGVKRQTERIRREAQQQARHGYENLEERIQERTAQLQAANRELEAFAYTISHDLRAPLRAVEGFASLLQNELPLDQQTPEVKHALDVIRASALRMSQLIEDLLEFARLGRIEATLAEVNFESLVWSVYEELKVQMGTRTVELRIHRLPTVFADAGMMRQLVTNLLSNAIKFTRPREVTRIEFASFEKGSETIFYVRDNGVGFDMRYASKLFGVFHRLHTDKRYEGTGVGLAIVHRILERHHGRIWVESEVDQGTTFYFVLGTRNAPVDPGPQPAEPLPLSGGAAASVRAAP